MSTSPDATLPPGTKFSPTSLASSPAIFSLPTETWISILSAPCTFESKHFLYVAENLIRNPNITSSYLFRAEIFYDSINDTSLAAADEIDLNGPDFSPFTRHMKAEYRPWNVSLPPGFERQRTWVRRLVPRNPKLDKDLVQTCHHLCKPSGRSSNPDRNDMLEEQHAIIYLPHASSATDIPYYHPAVRALTMLYTYKVGQTQTPAEISIHYSFFPRQSELSDRNTPETASLTDRLVRTANHLLSTVHRHGQGQLTGYVKRVHHDQVVPQAAFQDRYTTLKGLYAKDIIAGWVEQTDPCKHVFEDLGIAAFLVELWTEMYGQGEGMAKAKQLFPGFVDIGCGNGLLVFVLRKEGWAGWGFDARRRKTWDTFPDHMKGDLKEMILVPAIYQDIDSAAVITSATVNSTSVNTDSDLPKVIEGLKLQANEEEQQQQQQGPQQWQQNLQKEGPEKGRRPIEFCNGIFPQGTFIISSHADELTPWTPLIARLSLSPFISIPCCSHNLTGARFRAPLDKTNKSRSVDTSQPSTGSLVKPKGGPKPPSAYSALCGWVERLSTSVGFESEREVLRIPSTRNVAILGKKWKSFSNEENNIASGTLSEPFELREKVIRDVVLRELGGGEALLTEAAKVWVERAETLAIGKASGGH